jgi:hypothetical protein
LVEPDNVRYFLGHEHTAKTKVKPIPLPEDRGDEAFKYVREAVRGFPELYFSRLVILGEGASEEVVLSRLFKASGTPLDSHFISVVPLGGRHVNHFWRLLHGLGIPFLTLLDLDREKEGGGWGRIQYVRNELVQRFGGKNKRLEFTKDGKTHSIADAKFDTLHERSDTDIKGLNHWLAFFESEFDIFFASPLDLDFSMLEAFPSAYKGRIPAGRGPRLPGHETPDYREAIERRMKQVLAADVSSARSDLGSTYTEVQRELFAWYKYIFSDRSKPVAHMGTLVTLKDKELIKNAPKVLKDLVTKAQAIVASTDGKA